MTIDVDVRDGEKQYDGLIVVTRNSFFTHCHFTAVEFAVVPGVKVQTDECMFMSCSIREASKEEIQEFSDAGILGARV